MNGAGALREQIIAGDLSEERVRLSARLGHPGARAVFPDAELVNWSSVRQREPLVSEAMELLGEAAPTRVAADWAERVLPAWESWSREDLGPVEAVAAARAWADCPCEACSQLADTASKTADAAASTTNAATNPANAKAAEAANAASAAARTAVNQVVPIRIRFTTMTAMSASLASPDAEAEFEWQRLRLSAYLLGEV